MLMKDDKRATASLILQKRQPTTPDSSGNNSEASQEDDMYMIADEIMSAMKAGDVRALKVAMHSFVDCYNSKSETEGPAKTPQGPAPTAADEKAY